MRSGAAQQSAEADESLAALDFRSLTLVRWADDDDAWGYLFTFRRPNERHGVI